MLVSKGHVVLESLRSVGLGREEGDEEGKDSDGSLESRGFEDFEMQVERAKGSICGIWSGKGIC